MSNPRLSSHLKLVRPRIDPVEAKATSVAGDHTQPELFPMSDPSLLIFADISELTADSFVTLLTESKPVFVLDFRPTPRFDLGRLNRRVAFDIFRDNETTYVDVTGLIGASSRWDANLNPSFLVEYINNILIARERSVNGPMVLLFDDKELLSSSVEVFSTGLRKNEQRRWDVCLFPYTS